MVNEPFNRTIDEVSRMTMWQIFNLFLSVKRDKMGRIEPMMVGEDKSVSLSELKRIEKILKRA